MRAISCPGHSFVPEFKIKQTMNNTSTYSHQIKIEAVTIGSIKALTINDNGTNANIGEKLTKLFEEVIEAMKKENANFAGAPFAIYHKVVHNPDGSMEFTFEAGIPVDQKVKSSGRVNYRELQGGKAVKADHYGKHEDTAQTHMLMDAWMKKNNNKVIGAPWESYVTDPRKEPDSSKWLTQIFYPVA